jgi:hypothetical protein
LKRERNGISEIEIFYWKKCDLAIRTCLIFDFSSNIIHIFSEKDSNFEDYTVVIDEKLGFFVAKKWMILMERRMLNRF